MTNSQILILCPDQGFGQQLELKISQGTGCQVTWVGDSLEAEALIQAQKVDILILGDGVSVQPRLEEVARYLASYPAIPILLFCDECTEDVALSAMRIGNGGFLLPVQSDEILPAAINAALERREQLKSWAKLEARRNTQSLEKRLSGLEALQRVGRTVTALLDLDEVLTTVVEAAVELTGADEGSLLLLDETSGELYMRAAKNFREEFVRTFRIPVHDTLAGQVIKSAQPLVIDEQTPQKIKTAYLVHNLMYVPLMIHERVIGVLGVDKRQSGPPFTEYHLTLVSALSDYAAIAIENARLFANSEANRVKLETILTRISDGVIVVDQEGRLILINQAAREILRLDATDLSGKLARDTLPNPDLAQIFTRGRSPTPYRTEILLDDGRVMNTQVTPIPEIGWAVTLQDITQLKELDRIKTDFVNTVSHDLRSPLTAILGYVELISRVGPVNPQQDEFISRVKANVHNITALINDLLDLGRIEAGFDAAKEALALEQIIAATVEGLKNRFIEKRQRLSVNVPPGLPKVRGNLIRMRQMLANLLVNAHNYTPEGGSVGVAVRVENGQIILQVSDTGVGIPANDQPYIFNKFYRGSNVLADSSGTGLGLAIVKSIVENHHGRIWVDSVPGLGSTFTVVLPYEPTDGGFRG